MIHRLRTRPSMTNKIQNWVREYKNLVFMIIARICIQISPIFIISIFLHFQLSSTSSKMLIALQAAIQHANSNASIIRSACSRWFLSVYSMFSLLKAGASIGMNALSFIFFKKNIAATKMIMMKTIVKLERFQILSLTIRE